MTATKAEKQYLNKMEPKEIAGEILSAVVEESPDEGCQQFAESHESRPLALNRLRTSADASQASLLKLSKEIKTAGASRMVR